MATFQEFLEKKAAEHQQKERRERRQEWIASVGRLMDQLRAWLAESDPNHVLDVMTFEVEKAEPGLGTYLVPSIRINMSDDAAHVDVTPVGRNAVGTVRNVIWGPSGNGGARAEGRVDVTDGVRKYILYRVVKDGKDVWYTLDEAKPLDRDRLEAILQDLLA